MATLTATQALVFAASTAVTRTRWSAWRVGAALGLNAATHYLFDRRAPLRRIAAATGKSAFWDFGNPRPGHDDNPGLAGGSYRLDQSAHLAVLWLAALITAVP